VVGRDSVARVLDQAIPLDGRAAVLAATGDHPYTRMTTDGEPVTGYQTGEAVAWLGHGPWGPVACAVGDPRQAARLFADLAAEDRLAGVRWVHLPRVDGRALAPHLRMSHQDDWDFRWTRTPPPAVAGEERVVPLDGRHGEEIGAVLEDALPDTTSRPGDPRVRGWYGIFDGGRLVACGADRSRTEVGFLAAITVTTAYQGRGLGAALTAAMTRRLFQAYDVVALGVMSDNAGAIRLYRRLGFTGSLARSSVALT
jgi:ribosomal protein S18 acetylase RimI-like enzyme